MVSLIKNQLLKHLSIYTKNLSSDKINLSTFRGEGELSNLQLDEAVLTELLELPAWLRLTSAWCNHVSFRISWTKLKSVPITLTLDEVNITVETCEPNSRLSQENGSTAGMQSLPQVPQGKYSFIHKVVDGITIIVNTVNVKLLSAAFTASVQMSRIRVESKTPKWANADLRLTRLKDAQKGILLIFKELSWQTVRIEASSTQDRSLTPLRLLTNHAKCRITIRKRLSDCSLLASRLVLILDDLLWVLTDSQLKAALHFVDSLAGLIKAATAATQKTKAAKKLETLPEYQAQIAQQQNRLSEMAHLSTAQRMFNAFDVRETSYHFFSQHIDLHLCDDEGEGRSSYPELHQGGALQVSVHGFQIDYYPYHLAKSDRLHWAKYKEASVLPALWLKESLNAFREAVLNLSQPNRPAAHAPLERSAPASPVMLNVSMLSGVETYRTGVGGSGSIGTGSSTPTLIAGSGNASAASSQLTQSLHQKATLDKLAQLMSACVILRIEDFTLYRVTTSGKKQMPKEFVSGDKDRYSFPAEMPIVHAEFTYFYYPGDFIFPLPPSKMFVHMNPLQIQFDLGSILWFNSFALNLHESLLRTSVGSPTSAGRGSMASDAMNGDGVTINYLQSNAAAHALTANCTQEPNFMYMDVKVEAIMPRIIIESAIDTTGQKDRPKIMQIQISRFALTNIREMGSSRADLAQALHSLQEGSLVFGSDFPAMRGDLCIVTDRILSHVAASDAAFMQQDASTTSLPKSASMQNFSRYAMWSEPRDVWCIKLDPVWVDFLGARSLGANKSIPFIDAVPITLWLHAGNVGSAAATKVNSAESLTSNVKMSPAVPASTNAAAALLAANMPRNPFLSDEDLCNAAYSADDKNSVDAMADMHIIAHISNLVSVQIDHYQFLFLLRLAEEMNEMSTFLSLDAERILTQNHKKSIILGCVIPQIEVTLVMPSPTPGTTNINWPAPTLDQIKNSTFGSVETPSPVLNEPSTYDSGIHISNPNTHGYNVQIQSTPTVAPSTISCLPTASQNTSVDADVHTQSAGSTLSKSFRSNRSANTDANAITKEINSGLMSMKKGFSSFMTSIDSAIKSGTATDDTSDTFSIQSDISSDSENFAIVMGDDKTLDCLDVMFKLNPFTTDNIKASPVEVASEVCEEPYYKTNMSSPSEPSEGSTWRRRDLVSMATFRLTTVEIIRQNVAHTSSLRMQVAAISCDECGAIPWDELQCAQQAKKTKFGTRCKAWNLAPYNPEAPPCMRLRLEETFNPPATETVITDRKVIQSWFSHKADVRIKDVSLNLSMSTITGLTDLAEDEVITHNPLPVNISLENVKLCLMEDRPPVNITSPGPVPINLCIGRMHLERDRNGVVHIQPNDGPTINAYNNMSGAAAAIFNIDSSVAHQREKERDRELLSLQLVMQQIKLDNDNLRKQLLNAKENSDHFKQKTRQENDVLRSYLKAAQDDISILLEEKKALLDTVRSLQLQVTSSSNISKKSDGNR